MSLNNLSMNLKTSEEKILMITRFVLELFVLLQDVNKEEGLRDVCSVT